MPRKGDRQKHDSHCDSVHPALPVPEPALRQPRPDLVQIGQRSKQHHQNPHAFVPGQLARRIAAPLCQIEPCNDRKDGTPYPDIQERQNARVIASPQRRHSGKRLKQNGHHQNSNRQMNDQWMEPAQKQTEIARTPAAGDHHQHQYHKGEAHA